MLSQDVTGRRRRAGSGRHRVPARRRGRGAWCPALVAAAGPDVGVARAVGLAFAVAASTFCPLLRARHLVARPHRRRRARRAARRAARLRRRGRVDAARRRRTTGWSAVLLGQPAAWTRAARVRHDGGRLAADPAPGAGPHAAASWSGCTPPRPSRSTAAEPFRRARRPFVVRIRPLGDPPAPLGARPAPHPCPRACRPLPTRDGHHTSRGGAHVRTDARRPRRRPPALRARPGLRRSCTRPPEFDELRRRFRRFVFPATVAFLSWYLLYVVMSNWAPRLHEHKVVGNINVALVFGLLQFVTTFLIAWLYARYMNRKRRPARPRAQRPLRRRSSTARRRRDDR